MYIGGKKMKTKYVTVKVSYDTEETWDSYFTRSKRNIPNDE